MIKLQRYLTRIVLFLVVVVAVCGALIDPISTAFMSNPGLNGLILATLIVGIVYIIRQIALLKGEVAWIENFRKADSPAAVTRTPVLLGPMARMLGEDQRAMNLSALSMRTLLDGIGARLDEQREISRYLIGLLIFLGLLGTFWGLLGTIHAIGGTIDSLSVSSTDLAVMFDSLKKGLEAPLSGMGTAFSSSLFGLAGSVILGFLDLQAGQAQNRFFNDLEDWLSGVTKLSRASGGLNIEGDQSVPAYVSALLEQSADSLGNLQRVIGRSEDSREQSSKALIDLTERLETLVDQRKAEQELLVRLVESQNEMRAVISQLGDALAHMGEGGAGLDDASRGHLRNIDVHLKHLMEDSNKARNQFVDDIRSEFKLLARTLAAVVDRGSSTKTEEPTGRRPLTAERPTGSGPGSGGSGGSAGPAGK